MFPRVRGCNPCQKKLKRVISPTISINLWYAFKWKIIFLSKQCAESATRSLQWNIIAHLRKAITQVFLSRSTKTLFEYIYLHHVFLSHHTNYIAVYVLNFNWIGIGKYIASLKQWVWLMAQMKFYLEKNKKCFI